MRETERERGRKTETDGQTVRKSEKGVGKDKQRLGEVQRQRERHIQAYRWIDR